jgi:glyceraldehyde-3-phosphate dehydrogenase (NADP+)
VANDDAVTATRGAGERGDRTMMYVAGEWRGAAREEEVRSPFDGAVVGVVPVAGAADADLAVAAAVEGARVMRRLSAWERAEILRRAADLIDAELDELARTIALEAGKPLVEAQGEAARIPALLRLSASEGGACTARRCPSTRRRTGPASLPSR